jgi:transcription initiation factor TFIID subunit 7
MLLVDDKPVASEEAAFAANRVVGQNDHLYGHGLTPPLRHVRKRRFRKRLNKQVCSKPFCLLEDNKQSLRSLLM